MNNQIKAQVFAKYIYQDVYNYEGWGNSTNVLQVDWVEQGDKSRLLLRSVDMLTDEEAILLMKMQLTDKANETIEIKKLSKYKDSPFMQYSFINDDGRLIHSEIALFDGGSIESATNSQCDAMRALGIALPVTVLIDGKPTTLTVADLEREGVIKIVTNN